MTLGKPLWRVSNLTGREEERRGENVLDAVAVVSGHVEDGLLAGLHGDNTLVPAADDTADTDGGLEGAAANGGVEPGDVSF